jgi:hypothetical protein
LTEPFGKIVVRRLEGDSLVADISSSIVAGIFSLLAGLGGVVLKDYLDSRRRRRPKSAKLKKSHIPARVSVVPEVLPQQTQSAKLIAVTLLLGGWFLGNVGAKSRPIVNNLSDKFHWEALLALAILILGSMALAILYRLSSLKAKLIAYEAHVFCLWFGFTVSWLVTYDESNDVPMWSFLYVWIGWWLASGISGAVLLTVLNRWHQRRIDAAGV